MAYDPATDPNRGKASGPTTFGRAGRLITPGVAELNPIPKAVVVTTAGNITVVPVNNADADVIAFVGVPAGWSPPFQVRRVTAATVPVWAIDY